MQDQVVVVIGVGGMGEAIARRQGLGKQLIIADVDDRAAEDVATRLRADGYEVSTSMVDVGSRESVRKLAEAAAATGAVVQLVHTAGLSPIQASVEAIIRVDLYGVAAVLAEFGDVVAPHGAGVVIASMAGQVATLTLDQEASLMSEDVEDLPTLPFLKAPTLADSGQAYVIAKRANVLRVMSESKRWGRRRARLNSISPGVISTRMGREELGGESGAGMRWMIEASGTGRIGTSADIAEAAAFLLGPHASFVTGSDLLVDGGATAALRAGSR